ncbi:MAG: hypothetical protein R6U57_05430 [Anaerolineales bacterium]
MPTEPQPTHLKDEKKRPWPVTALCAILLCTSLVHILKMSQALIHWDLLQTLPLSASPLYLALHGFLWGTVGAAVTFMLWKGLPWARRITLILALLYSLWFWVDAAWVKAPEVFRTRWPFNLAVTLAGLSLVTAAVYLPSSRAYFQEMRDRTQHGSDYD